jgi:hypothetical protein
VATYKTQNRCAERYVGSIKFVKPLEHRTDNIHAGGERKVVVIKLSQNFVEIDLHNGLVQLDLRAALMARAHMTRARARKSSVLRKHLSIQLIGSSGVLWIACSVKRRIPLCAFTQSQAGDKALRNVYGLAVFPKFLSVAKQANVQTPAAER